MDDLWGNAWGSPGDVKDHGKTLAWSTPEKTRNDGPQEDDLSMPSWSTGPGIRWDEPSDALSPLWSTGHYATQQDSSLDNPYGNIPLGNSSHAELPNNDNSNDLGSHATPPTAQVDDRSASPPSAELELEEDLISSQALSSVHTPGSSPPPSPDAFGTFIAGAEPGDVVPFPSDGGSHGSQLYSNEWDSPWRSATRGVDGDSLHHTDDEWESAKLKQLEMDSRVVSTIPWLISFVFHNTLSPGSLQNYFRAFFSSWRTLRRTLGQGLQMRLNQAGRDNGILEWMLMACESTIYRSVPQSHPRI